MAEAIIYLAKQRGCSQVSWHRSYHTFNFGAYYNEHKKPAGDLLAFNDDTLKGGASVTRSMKEDEAILLLPMVGALEYKNGSGAAGTVEAGQSHLLFARKNSDVEISNPYESELINYLEIWFRISPAQRIAGEVAYEFSLDRHRNQLIPFLSASDSEEKAPFKIHGLIGKFAGREDGAYTIKDPTRRLFVFVIEGAFEVQDRLLEARDGLLLWNTEQVEFEALSPDAIILLLEIPTPTPGP
jgi:redox-sensitive bicupin YhaK (pirin superfamily)